MAFPQETFLNARWSDDQSAATPRQPGGRSAMRCLVFQRLLQPSLDPP